MFKFNKLLIGVNCFILVISFVNIHGFDDLHSSITTLEKVFQTEKLYIENMEIYLDYSTRIVNALKGKLKEYKANRPFSFGSEFTLDKKIEYRKKINYIYESSYTGFYENISLFKEKYQFPNNADLEGVIKGINRLQQIYNYTAKEIATGTFIKVENMKNTTKLTSSDCFEIGYRLSKIEDKKIEAEEWFELAYDLYNNNTDGNNKLKQPRPLTVILDLLAYAKHTHGDINHVKEAIELMKIAISIDPKREHYQNQLKAYTKLLKNLKEHKANEIRTEQYEKGCRAELQKSPHIVKKLFCTYKYGQHPFLKLAPIKVEIQNIKPYVAVFHDILYDDEIEIVKNLSYNLLLPALIWNPIKAKSELSEIRTGKCGWLENEFHPVLKIINQRLTDMTDLSMETSELLQVMNYGVGGHYDVHHDCLDDPEADEFEYKPFQQFHLGNRIATIMFYMSDVEQGGATVFPSIKTTIYPEKGSAIFWFNMLPQGTIDSSTYHAGCPVVLGSKWVANKWVRYNGEIFQRQCKKDEHAFYHTFGDLEA